MISYLKVCRLEWNFPVKGMTTLTSVARKWDAHAHWNTWPRRPSASAGYEVYVLKKIKLRLKRLHISIAIFHIVAHQKIWCKDIISYQLFSIFMFISEIWPFSYFTLGHFFSFHIGSLESSFAICRIGIFWFSYFRSKVFVLSNSSARHGYAWARQKARALYDVIRRSKQCVT